MKNRQLRLIISSNGAVGDLTFPIAEAIIGSKSAVAQFLHQLFDTMPQEELNGEVTYLLRDTEAQEVLLDETIEWDFTNTVEMLRKTSYDVVILCEDLITAIARPVVQRIEILEEYLELEVKLAPIGGLQILAQMSPRERLTLLATAQNGDELVFVDEGEIQGILHRTAMQLGEEERPTLESLFGLVHDLTDNFLENRV